MPPARRFRMACAALLSPRVLIGVATLILVVVVAGRVSRERGVHAQAAPPRRAPAVVAASAPKAPAPVVAKANMPGAARPAAYADPENFGYGSSLTPLERRGRDTWYFWTGGNQRFFRQVAIASEGYFDLLQVIDSRRAGKRFLTLGMMTDPRCTPATQADENGLWLDNCPPDHDILQDIPGTPTGVVGLRKFENPKFDKSKWSLAKYMEHPKNAEPPYLVGMACGFCHIGPNPLNPPEDPEHPQWENMAAVIGNQYLEDAKLFTIRMTPDDFRWHVAFKQPAGTVDTSRFATDHISNPNAINSIFHLGHRPAVEEKMKDGTTRAVHHILKDGSDSIGIAGASMRVYVNIGMCSEYWLTLHQAIYGMMAQKPFRMEQAKKECAEWAPTEERMPAAAAFLMTAGPMPLKDAPGGGRYLAASGEVLHRGRVVFAENCATCHSSKQPPASVAADPTARVDWFRREVVKDDFLDGNYLSDDRRYPVTYIGTNAARALASNAINGHIWEEFSSETYKQLPSAGKLTGLYNPLDPTDPIDFTLPAGGRGYYRTPTLVSLWATAPFLHNNSVGIFTKDPSVAGRMIAFQDGIEKMLWPEWRLGIQSVPVTTTPSTIRLFTGPEMHVPVNTAINVIARVNPLELPSLGQRSINFLTWAFGDEFLLGRLLAKNLAPDFIEDRGHVFGSTLSDDDKRALIAFIKTF